MTDTTFKSIELVGTSGDSYAQATRNALQRASQTMRELRWFEVVEMRGQVGENGSVEFQVRLEVWFELEG